MGSAPGKCHLSPACPSSEKRLSELKGKGHVIGGMTPLSLLLDDMLNNNLLTATSLSLWDLFSWRALRLHILMNEGSLRIKENSSGEQQNNTEMVK